MEYKCPLCNWSTEEPEKENFGTQDAYESARADFHAKLHEHDCIHNQEDGIEVDDLPF